MGESCGFGGIIVVVIFKLFYWSFVLKSLFLGRGYLKVGGCGVDSFWWGLEERVEEVEIEFLYLGDGRSRGGEVYGFFIWW